MKTIFPTIAIENQIIHAKILKFSVPPTIELVS